MRLTDAELAELASDLESERVERKESFKGDAPEKVRQAVCAFANDLSGSQRPGIVLIGLRDNATPSGLDVSDDLLLSLADIKSDGNILPLPTMTVEKRRVTNSDVAVITVAPADAPPVRYKGRIYIRTGPRRAVASSQDERILNERRRHRDLPFDLQPLSFATLRDLDQRTFETEYLPGAFAPEVLAANGRKYEERLAACRMIESSSVPTPTVMGSLVLGTRPRDLLPSAYIQFLRLDGNALDAPIVDQAQIDGRLSDMLRKIDERLAANIGTAVDIHSQSTEKRHGSYPIAALQQLVRNAVMHRTYEGTHAPIRLTWFRDRIELVNPGGPFGIVTRSNFGQPGITDYRNPNLAEAMKVLGYVQRFGVGIATARRLLDENGNPPLELQPYDSHVLATIRVAS